ncbi:hypothetical protein EDB92DRAFT_107331 [Lactarius akahatsu]|uniref:Uncharacterized protein n=1 Tax=Lactarius akahatsu TaxID=416441 RepID=A0AAD4QFV5_9AGAM|nr:hypothetical protein EDB92DRAFT_107331 [Lactarius akahatsu]
MVHHPSALPEFFINAIGAVTIAILYGNPLQFVAQHRPQPLRPIILGGLVICVASVFISSLVTKVRPIIACSSQKCRSRSFSRYGTLHYFKEFLGSQTSGCMHQSFLQPLEPSTCTPISRAWAFWKRSLASSCIFGGSGLGGVGFRFSSNSSSSVSVFVG